MAGRGFPCQRPWDRVGLRSAHHAGRIERDRHHRGGRGDVSLDPRNALRDRHGRSAVPAREQCHLQAGHPVQRLGAAPRGRGRGPLLPSVQHAQPAARRPGAAALLAARGRGQPGVRPGSHDAKAGCRCVPRAEADRRRRLPRAAQLCLSLRCPALCRGAQGPRHRARRAPCHRDHGTRGAG